MSFAETAVLGAIAGFTIFLGLPIGRAANMSSRARVGLSMLSAGILAFIFMDVGSASLGILETHLDAYKEHSASLWPVIGLFALLGAGFLVGVGGIATVQRRLLGRASEPPPMAGAESTLAMNPAELADHRMAFEAGWTHDGAVCVNHPRVKENISLGDIAARWHRLAGRTGARCTEETARSLGALLFNRSVP